MLCIHSTAPCDTSSVFTSVSEPVVKERSLLVPLVIRRDQRCDLLGFLSAGKFSGSSACISPETSPDHNHTRGSRFCRQPVWRVRHFTTGCIDEKNKHRSADTRRLDGKVLGHKKSTRTMVRATGTRKQTKQLHHSLTHRNTETNKAAFNCYFILSLTGTRKRTKQPLTAISFSHSQEHGNGQSSL